MKKNIIIQTINCVNEEKEFNYNYLNSNNNVVNKSNIGLFNVAQNSDKVITSNSFFTFDNLGETNTSNINYILNNDFITIQKDMFLNIAFSTGVFRISWFFLFAVIKFTFLGNISLFIMNPASPSY